MYYWTDDNEMTHVLDVRNRPPAEPLFGYQSLCEDVLVPVEGEDLELTSQPSTDIPCSTCATRYERHGDPGERTLAQWAEHLVEIDRDSRGRLKHARLLCDGPLHRRLDFEPPEFSGDLRTQVATVCDDCWSRYQDRQWSARDEQAQLAVTVWGDDGKDTYFATTIEAQGSYEDRATLLLVSRDGLEQEISREHIADITLTQCENVVY